MISARKIKEDAQGIRVLYVEDDRELRENTRRLLSSFFSDIETAENGQEGLNKYRNGSFDIVISDVTMPVINGIKMLEQIKADKNHPAIIVISAQDEDHYLVDLINLGIDNVVLKPLDIQHFLAALDKAIKVVRFGKTREEYLVL